MNEERLWELVVKRRKALKKSLDGQVPPQTRGYLKDRGYVEDACLQDDEDRAVKLIIGEIDALAGAHPESTGGRDGYSRNASSETEETAIPVEPGHRERNRTRTLAELQIKEASKSTGVKSVRKGLEGAGSLAPDEVEEVMSFIAKAPDILPEDVGPNKEFLEVWLRLLDEVADDLSARYTWDKNDAIRFILGGEIPSLSPLQAFYRATNTRRSAGGPTSGRIVLEIVPWVSPKVVEKAYRRVQQRVCSQRYQPISESRLEVLRFVEEQTDEHGRRPPYEYLLKLWNEKNPAWHYSSYRSFRKAYTETREKLLDTPNLGPSSLTIAAEQTATFDLSP